MWKKEKKSETGKAVWKRMAVFSLSGRQLFRLIGANFRPGLNIGNMSSGEGFFRLTSNFSAEILPDYKEKW